MYRRGLLQIRLPVVANAKPPPIPGSMPVANTAGIIMETCEQSNQSIQYANDTGVGNQVIFIRQIGSVCNHDTHTKREREECLTQSNQNSVAVDGRNHHSACIFRPASAPGSVQERIIRPISSTNSKGIRTSDIFSIPAVP